jgi:hypothetical protein
LNAAVIVTDVHALGMIAVLRSLGRGGYRVHGLSSTADALGFKSCFIYRCAVHPLYESPAFIPWLQNYLITHNIEAIIPSEAFLHAIASNFSQFKKFITDACDQPIWERSLSKVETWRFLSTRDDTRKHLPLSGVIADEADINMLESPDKKTAIFYLKADAGHARGNADARVVRILGIQELQHTARQWLADFHQLVWQCYVPGKKVGVSLWRHSDEFHAENMVLGLHQFPHLGGMMSLRQTWWHEKLLEDAKIKMAALGLNGIAMMEYKWDPQTDDFWFIEINARYWGYLHLDLACGKDFPKWQMDAHFGHVHRHLGQPRQPCVMRYTVPGDFSYLVSLWRDKEVPFRQKIYSICEFLWLSLDLRIGTDLWFAGDRALYLRGWLRFLQQIKSRITNG